MTIEVSCPQCAKRYQVDDNFAGRKAKCKACGAQMTIPAPLAEEIETYSIEPLPSTPSLIDEWADSEQDTSSQTLPPLQRQPRQATPATPASSATKPRKTKVGPLPMSTRAAIMLPIAGAIALYFGYREWRLSSLCDTTPQKITCAQLVENGPGDNIYLDLTEFCLLPDQSVIESDGDDLRKSNWSYVWIPAVPCDQNGQPAAREIKVIIGTKSVNRASRLGHFCQKPTLRGLIVNETDNIRGKARDLLSEGMPGVDVASCYFFREGQGPTSGVVHALLIGGGSIMLLIGIGLGILQIRARFC